MLSEKRCEVDSELGPSGRRAANIIIDYNRRGN